MWSFGFLEVEVSEAGFVYYMHALRRRLTTHENVELMRWSVSEGGKRSTSHAASSQQRIVGIRPVRQRERAISLGPFTLFTRGFGMILFCAWN